MLINALKDEIGIPIHLHTHDTTGIQAATLFAAAEAGVDIVDAALASMNGHPRDIRIYDKSRAPAQPKKAKADPGNLHQVAAPMLLMPFINYPDINSIYCSVTLTV